MLGRIWAYGLVWFFFGYAIGIIWSRSVADWWMYPLVGALSIWLALVGLGMSERKS